MQTKFSRIVVDRFIIYGGLVFCVLCKLVIGCNPLILLFLTLDGQYLTGKINHGQTMKAGHTNAGNPNIGGVGHHLNH